MPGDDVLLEAIAGLRDAVRRLTKTLEENYPKRSEIRQDRKFFAVLIILGVVAAMVVSAVITIGTVSGCFLSKAAVDGHAASVCSIMPGYDEALDRAERANGRTGKLFSDTADNKRKLKAQHRRLLKQEKEIRTLKEEAGIE